MDDIDNLLLKGKTLSADVRTAIKDATLARSIDLCPTLTLEIQDRRRVLLKSGLLAQRVTAQFHDYAFELAKVEKNRNQITVVMEDLAVAELRRWNSTVTAPAGTVSRVDFVRQILAAETPWIKLYVDPSVVEPVATIALSRGSVASGVGDAVDPNFFTPGDKSAALVTGAGTLSASQIAGVASAAGFKGANLTIAVAVALAESGGRPSAINKANRNGSTDYGLWQINSVHADLLSKGTWSDPSSNARMAYSIAGNGVNWKPWSTFNNGAYKKFMGTAATAAGSPTGVADGKTSIGPGSSTLEDSWSCFKRIFNEVNWRLYADKGNLYAGPDSAFIDKDPIVTVREFENGIDWIDYDYDTGKPVATLTISGRLDYWLCPPGSVIRVPDLGLPSEKWLCSSISRSIFHKQTTIQAAMPSPEIPEAAAAAVELGLNELPALAPDGVSTSGKASDGKYIWPTGSRNVTSPFGPRPGHSHPHEGIDIAVPQGTPVYASRAGTVTHASNTDPGGYGNAVYIAHRAGNTDNFVGPVAATEETRYGHLSAFKCRAGQVVQQGTLIGLSGGAKGTPGAGDATGPHLHFEVRVSGRAVNPIEKLSNSPLYGGGRSGGSGASGSW